MLADFAPPGLYMLLNPYLQISETLLTLEKLLSQNSLAQKRVQNGKDKTVPIRLVTDLAGPEALLPLVFSLLPCLQEPEHQGVKLRHTVYICISYIDSFKKGF
jgi:hypothetical protein